ncbi:MAG: histidine kinase [Burkholderiaceae bacterium]|nr:histidine kinase [Burkholderiaceae bacterium]
MSPAPSSAAETWQAFRSGTLRAFHRYASWLVSISWKRFILLSLLLIIASAITQSLPPFSYTVSEEVEVPIELPDLPDLPEIPEPPAPPKPAKAPAIRIEKPAKDAPDPDGVEISIDERGIRIRPKNRAADAAASAATPASGAASASSPGSIEISLPQSATREVIQEAIDAAREALEESVAAQREAQQDAAKAARDAHRAARDAIREARDALKAVNPGGTRTVTRNRVVHWGDFLTDLALIWIVASAIIKMVYKGRIQAEVKAAQATETAEAESLKRQVVEARMAAMQAQVEPHFLFNTLASIDHLIETDPPRASQMQKNLIALLRASMPTMREAAGNGSGGVRDLGRELQVIRPYLEILKVRMEERLSTEIDVPEGLQSAEFPPMMIQTLVENAIKHGLEPKAEGGHLRVKAEVVHGKLAVSVADTGLGFGKAATAGTGVGLANIRERLQMLYGAKASVAVTANEPSGTIVTITVPYKPVEEGAAA